MGNKVYNPLILGYEWDDEKEPYQSVQTGSFDGTFFCRHDSTHGRQIGWRSPQLCGTLFHRLRQIIAKEELEAESEAMFGGEIEVDESYFGGRRKGRCGCGASGKIPVLGY